MPNHDFESTEEDQRQLAEVRSEGCMSKLLRCFRSKKSNDKNGSLNRRAFDNGSRGEANYTDESEKPSRERVEYLWSLARLYD